MAIDNAMLQKCIDAGLHDKSTRVDAKVLDQSYDHPDAELLYKRANEIDSTISIATIYRTLGSSTPALCRKLMLVMANPITK